MSKMNLVITKNEITICIQEYICVRRHHNYFSMKYEVDLGNLTRPNNRRGFVLKRA